MEITMRVGVSRCVSMQLDPPLANITTVPENRYMQDPHAYSDFPRQDFTSYCQRGFESHRLASDQCLSEQGGLANGRLA